jgi:hypothetical protein
LALQELEVDFPSLMSKDRLVQVLSAGDSERELNLQELELLEQFGEQIPVELLLSELGGGSRYVAEKLYQRYPAVFREVVAPQAEAILRGEPMGGCLLRLCGPALRRLSDRLAGLPLRC